MPLSNGHEQEEENGNGNGHPNGFEWRATRPYLAADDGMSAASTESEAEGSHRSWSDNGWSRHSPASTQTRPSLSSGDEPYISPYSSSACNSRVISFTPAHPPQNNVSHRRQTITKSWHRSSATIDGLPPSLASNGTNGNLCNLITASPTHVTPSTAVNGFEIFQSYPRARRKSLSHPPAIPAPETDDDLPLNGTPHGKGKKKRRSTSFSLPFHRRRRLSNASYWRWWNRKIPSPMKLWVNVLLLIAAVMYGVISWTRTYELQLEFSFFHRNWIRREVDTLHPLRGCFDPHNMSPEYNVSVHLAPKRQLLAPGVALRRGMSCYDFSSTVQPIPGVSLEPLTYHTYWRSDLVPFGERHTATLTSFLVTQPLTHSKLILWSNGADVVANNPFVKPYLEKWGANIEIRQVDMNALTRGTELAGVLSGIDGGGLFDERAWVDGDAVRLLVLWHFGGVWLDMDQILTRDLHPLTESEFVTQWDCYDKPYFTLNGALMHFRKHSPYLCEAFHIMASSPLPRPNTFTWGAHLYAKLHRRLLAGRQRPFDVLPWCFTDPRNCRSDIRFPDPFEADPLTWGGRRWDGRGEVGRSGRELLEEKVSYVWTVHLHNQWRKEFPAVGWMARLLEGYKRKLDGMDRYAKSVTDPGEATERGWMTNEGFSPLGEKVFHKRRTLNVESRGVGDEQDLEAESFAE